MMNDTTYNKLILLSALVFLSMTANQVSAVSIYSESFETNKFNTNYVMNRFSDGDQDYFGVVDASGNTQYITANASNPFAAAMTNLNGTKCVGAEDLKRFEDAGDNPLNTFLDQYRGYFLTKTLNVSAYGSVEVRLLIGARSTGTYEVLDFDALRIQYAFDGNIATGANNTSPGLPNANLVYTGNYTDIGRFLVNGTTLKMQQDTDLDGIPDGVTLENPMVEYLFTIPVTGTNLSVRIHMDYDDSAEEIAFDFIRLEGVAAPNTAPTVTGVPSVRTVIEDTASNFDLSALSFADGDGDNLTVTLSASAGTFTSASAGSVTVAGSGSNSIMLAGTAANINTFLDTLSNIKYTSTLNANGNNAETFTLNANDGTVNPEVGNGSIDITAVNDDPTMTSIPTNVTVIEDIASDLNMSTIVFSDVDAATSTVDLTLSVGEGTLQASNSGGVSVSGSSTTTLTLTGTASNIDSYLNTASNIQYTSAQDATGNNVTTLSLVANDGGNTGTGGGSNINFGTINIDITGVNDAPSFNITGDINLTQSVTLFEVFPLFAFNVDLGPNESNQNVLNYNLTVVSDTYGVVSQIGINTAGNLSVNFSGNAGIAIFEAVLQDDGGVNNNGEDTSAPLSFFISFADLIFVNGFEPIASSISAYINAYKTAYPLEDYPIFDKENSLVEFHGHYFDVSRYDASTTVYLFRIWLNEILFHLYLQNN